MNIPIAALERIRTRCEAEAASDEYRAAIKLARDQSKIDRAAHNASLKALQAAEAQDHYNALMSELYDNPSLD